MWSYVLSSPLMWIIALHTLVVMPNTVYQIFYLLLVCIKHSKMPTLSISCIRLINAQRVIEYSIISLNISPVTSLSVTAGHKNISIKMEHSEFLINQQNTRYCNSIKWNHNLVNWGQKSGRWKTYPLLGWQYVDSEYLKNINHTESSFIDYI